MATISKIKEDSQKHKDAVDGDIKTGEQSISGSTPDPESDDNTQDTAHDAGIYENQDEEHQGEIDIAKEVEKDEKALRKGD